MVSAELTASGPAAPTTAQTLPHPLTASGKTGDIIFDGKAVTIIRNCRVGGWHKGRGLKTVPISASAAIEWRSASWWANGFIRLTPPADVGLRVETGIRAAARDVNAVVFTKKQAPEFEVVKTAIEAAIRNAVKAAISARHQS